MKDFAKNYIGKYQSLNKWIKVVLCLLWDIPSNLYRFSKSVLKDSTFGMVMAIVIAIFGGWVLFVVDILCLIIQNKIYWLDDLGLEGESNSQVDDQTATAEVKNDTDSDKTE